MEHVKSDLGQLKRGSTVVVTLGSQANVLLMDSSNYRTYASGRGQYRYHGGLVKTSPFRLTVPNDGHWYLAIDLGGASGTIRSSVQVEPPPRGNLPPARTAQPLDNVRHRPSTEAPPMPNELPGGRTWDVFISHASEDKADVARPLALALEALGIEVWLDEVEMRIGDSLRRKIDQGIRASRFSAVIFSPDFFAKGWTQYELDGIVTRTVAGEQNLLPIWHKVTKDQVMNHSPSLADKIARTTSTHSVSEIAAEIAGVVKGDTS